jgi:hypothetical protein
MARRGGVSYAPPPVRSLRSIAFACVLSAAFVAAGFVAGCAPQIGNSCSTSANCSINGDRICDIAQPGGYCTVFDCQPDRCPDDSVCVRFNPEPARRAVLACMRACGGDGDCRTGDGYRCVSAAQLLAEDLTVEVTDSDMTRSFCVALAAE